MTQSDQDIIKLLEKTKQRSKDTRRFKKFRELSFSTVFSKLNTVKKIKESDYYTELNTELTSKTPNSVESLQELLKTTYSIQDTLMSFVLKQLKTFTTVSSNTIQQNKELAENIQKVHDHIKSGNGEKVLIKQIMYFLLFLYFHEFEIKPFIPVFIEYYEMYNGKYDIKETIQKAFIFSKLYYLKHKNYLPVIIIIDLGVRCKHAINFVCLPSRHINHKFDNIIIDTSKLTRSTCKEDFLIVLNEINMGFKNVSTLFKENIILTETLDSCVKNLQGNYGTCVNYSLGVTLNCLFQEDHSVSRILTTCYLLDIRNVHKINVNLFNHILVTIGNVSHIFNKLIRKLIFKKVEKIYEKTKQKYKDKIQVARQIYMNTKEQNEDPKLGITPKEALEFRNNFNAKVYLNKVINLSDVVIRSLENLKNLKNLKKNGDKKLFNTISKFLKECGKAIYKWDMINIDKFKLTS